MLPWLHELVLRLRDLSSFRRRTRGRARPRRLSHARFGIETLEGRVLPSITGVVFQDFNGNGVLQTTATATNAGSGTVGLAVDQGIPGVTVTAYDTNNNVAATSTTAANGTYTLATSAGNYRVEFSTIPTGFYDSVLAGAGNSGTEVQFVSDGATNVNLGLIDPQQYSPANPTLYTTQFIHGAANGPEGSLYAVLDVPYNSGSTQTGGTIGTPGTYQDPTTHNVQIPDSQVGAVLGEAYDPFTNTLYVAAYTKKYTGYGPGADGYSSAAGAAQGSNGAIYAIGLATITSATESGTTATITTSSAPGFTVGQTVDIGGVGVAGYNGTFTITGVTGNTFTYTTASGLGSSSGGDAAVVNLLTDFNNVNMFPGSTGVNFRENTSSTIAASPGGAKESVGGTVTITAPNSFAVGDVVNISGVPVAGYNGTFTVVSASATAFTYTDPTTGLANSGGGTVTGYDYAEDGQNTGWEAVGTTGFGGMAISTDGQTLYVMNLGDRNLYAVPLSGAINNTTVQHWAIPSGTTNVPGMTGTVGTFALTAGGVTESGTTVTLTTALADNIHVGDSITVAGVGVAGYNGSFIVTAIPTTTTIQYTAQTSGLAASGGGTATDLGDLRPFAVTVHQESVGGILQDFVYVGAVNDAASVAADPTATIAAASSTGATESGNVVTIKASNGFTAGNTVQISGVGNNGYDGIYTITAASGTTFQYTDPTLGLTASGGGTAIEQIAEQSLQADVFRFDPVADVWTVNPNAGALSGSETWFQISNMTYDRGDNDDYKETGGHVMNDGNWHPWTTSFVQHSPFGGNSFVDSQPMLASLAFDAQGNLTLGLRDRSGDESENDTTSTAGPTGGAYPYGNQDGTGSGATFEGYPGSEILRAFGSPANFNGTPSGWTLENDGKAPASTSTATIAAATEVGNTVTITTTAAHNFQLGSQVIIAGVAVTGYNGTFTITDVSTTTFTYTDGTTGLANSTTGTPTATVKSAQGSGVNDGFGPGGGQYYGLDYYPAGHEHVTDGTFLQLPGYPDLVASTFDPTPIGGDYRTGGFRWFGNSNTGSFVSGGGTTGTGPGAFDKAYQLYNQDQTGTFQKEAGLGGLVAGITLPPVEIGDRVWLDTNGDGIEEAGEPGIAGVTVDLYSSGGTLLATAVTDSNGYYIFSSGSGTSTGSQKYNIAGLTPNTSFTISLDNAVNYGATGPLNGLYGLTASPALQGTDNKINSKGVVIGPTDVSTTANTGGPGDNDHTFIFGFKPSVSISGTDYLVSNTTTAGSLTTATTGVAIAGTTITLSGSDAFGNPVNLTTTTDASGHYSFTGLSLSNSSGYTVTETPPASDSHLGQTSTTGGAVTTTSPLVSKIVLTTGGASSTDNFFETNSVSINGTDYLVPNTTTAGSLTTSTTGVAIAGTTVTLSGKDVFGNIVSASTTTDASGNYSFTGLNLSNSSGYTVTETPPASDSHLGQTSTTVGAVSTPATSPLVSTIVLTSNGASSTDNFFETNSVSINGTDYLVPNTTTAGSLTTSTTGVAIAGTTVTLSGKDVFGNIVSASTTTDASGNYSFTGLNLSNSSGYTVTETPPASDSHLGQTSTTGGAVTTTSPLVSKIVLTTGGASSTDNFFETGTVSINGTDYLVPNTTTAGSLTTSTTGVAIAGTTVTLSGKDVFGNIVSASTTTDASGNYSFTGLNLSNSSGYTVTETPPASDSHLGQTSTTVGAVSTPATSPLVSTIVLTSNGASSTDNFFETNSVSINGTDYLVPNTTTAGSLTTSTTGVAIAGTTVTLSGKDVFGNIVSASTTTDASGNYSFTGLNLSNSSGYTVTETPPASDSHLGQTSTTVGAVSTPATSPLVSKIVLTTGGASSTDNFFETNSVSINGTDYLVPNTTTAGSLTTSTTGVAIAGTTVTLSGKDVFGNIVSASTTTDASGNYSFTGLNLSNSSGYTVTETPPASDSHLGQTSTTGGAVTTTSPLVSKIVLTTGGASSTDNFFETNSVSINGTDYLVPNTTTAGSLTTSTTGVAIAGTTVTLSGKDVFGNIVSASTTTDASGNYSFTGLNLSNSSGYTVTETPPASDSHLGQTSTTVGAVSTPATSPLVSKIVLTTGGASSTDNFFETAAVSINGTDYLVPNTTTAGSLTTSTTGVAIAGTTVTLSGKDVFGNIVSASTTTDASGNYSFTGLNLSNSSGYTVTETPPASDSHLGQTSTTGGAVTTTSPLVSKIVLTTGGASSTDNFFETNSVSINGTDYLVPNTTTAGSLTTSTTGVAIAGTTVTLSGKDVFGNIVSASTTTDASGNYSFTGLNLSNSSGYTVTETPPASDSHLGQTSTTVGAVSTPATSPLVSKIVLTTGGASSTDNFFETAAVSINGTDYLVPNTTTAGSLTTSTTGVAIAGTTFTLSGKDVFGNIVSASTTTDASGNYSFTGLNLSNSSGYTVTETPPASDSHLGQTSTTGGAVTTTSPLVSKIVLTTGGASSTDNFFETGTVSINGTDYLVPNTTTAGSLTTSTTGVAIAGTTVTLSGKDVFGNIVSASTTTDASGNYSFTGLNLSNSSGYTVTETPPASDSHLGQTSTTVGAVSTPATSPLVSKIVLTTGGASSTDNFFEIAAVSINGTDYLVPNTTTAGSLTTSTTGVAIAGTTVTLRGKDVFGNIVSASTTTDASGNYSFTGLNLSNSSGYTVTETPPASDSHLGQTSTTGGAVTTTSPVVSTIVLTSNGASSTDNFFETNSVSINGTDYLVPNTTTAGSLTTSTTGVAIAGTTVTLSGKDVFGNIVSASTTTDASGNYSFTGLNLSNSSGYTVTETPPASDSHLGQTSTTVGAVSTPATSPLVSKIVLTTGGASSTDNFFETNSVSINGTDYLVPNTTTAGSLTTSTTGVAIAGTTVTLSGKDVFGNIVSALTTTDASGNYSFTGLNLSNSSGYTVTETPPASDSHLGQTSTTGGAVTTTSPLVSKIVLTTGGASSTDNFFETGTVSINGTDYLVPNTTTAGSLTTSTTGVAIAGTTVTLSGKDVFGNIVSASTTTDASGNYNFTGLNLSNSSGYTVTETPPASDSHLGQTSTTGGAVTTTSPVVSTIVLTSNGASSTDNFFETNSVSINGTDYLVPNTTTAGSLTTSTTGVAIAGTTVTLSGKDVFGNIVSASTTTDASGNYSFTGLNLSNSSGYTVTETPPASDSHLGQTSTTVGAVSTPATSPLVSKIVLTTGGASSTDNFFETNSVSINGTDYLVPNTTTAGSLTTSTTGVAIAGTTVTLSGKDVFGNIVSASTTTDASGNYSFTGLNLSNSSGYTVTETPPASDSHLGQTSTTGGAVTTTSPLVSKIVLTTGGASSTDNFFEIAAVSINGTDYLVPNTTTAGSLTTLTTGVAIAGTTVTLSGKDVFGNIVSASTTTDASGNYSFTGLNLSNSSGYTVTETPPASDSHLGQTSTTGGAVSTSATSPLVSNILLTTGGVSSTDNFFEFPPSTPIVGTGTSATLDPLVIYDLSQSGSTSRPAALVSQFQPFTIPTSPFMMVPIPPPSPLESGSGVLADELGSLSGYVFHDVNRDGTFDGTDEPLANIAVVLSGSQGVRTAKTDVDGYYEFTGLGAGRYSVSLQGRVDRQVSTGIVGQIDGNLVGADGRGTIDRIMLPPGGKGREYDFAEVYPNAIEGRVYDDANENGVNDDQEDGIPNVRVLLVGSTSSGLVKRETRTDKDGNYQFTNLRPGKYVVQVGSAIGYEDADAEVGTAGGDVRTAKEVGRISLDATTKGRNYNFGKRQSATRSERPRQPDERRLVAPAATAGQQALPDSVESVDQVSTSGSGLWWLGTEPLLLPLVAGAVLGILAVPGRSEERDSLDRQDGWA